MSPLDLAYLLTVLGLFGWLIVIIVVAIVTSIAAFYRWLQRLKYHFFD